MTSPDGTGRACGRIEKGAAGRGPGPRGYQHSLCRQPCRLLPADPNGHVEAGCAHTTSTPPIPEEFNRQAIGLTARWHFAPTQTARENLLREGKPPEHIFVTGNTGIDALHTTIRRTTAIPSWTGPTAAVC